MATPATSTDSLLTDATWQALEPSRTHIEARSWQRLVTAVGVVATVGTLAALISASGVITARLDRETLAGSADAAHRRFTVDLTVTNRGKLTERVDAMQVGLPGVTFTSAHLIPTALSPGKAGTLHLEATVTNCSLVRQLSQNPEPEVEASDNQMRLKRPWGSAILNLDSLNGTPMRYHLIEQAQLACTPPEDVR